MCLQDDDFPVNSLGKHCAARRAHLVKTLRDNQLGGVSTPRPAIRGALSLARFASPLDGSKSHLSHCS